MKTLEQTAQAAGLVDMDLLKLVGAGVPPALAMSDLQRRFPSAFAKNALDMTPAEFRAAKAKLLQPPAPASLPDNLRKHVDDMTLDEREAFERFHGLQITSGERRRRQQVRDARAARQEMRG